jgi:hypothetical protein
MKKTYLSLAVVVVTAAIYAALRLHARPDSAVEPRQVVTGNCDASNPFGPVKPGCPQIIPYDRLMTWQPGVTYNGGIPARPTVCATVPPNGSSTGDAANITAAIAACPPGETVALTAGTYHFAINDEVFFDSTSDVTLRGTVDGNGRPTSNFELNSQFAAINGENLFSQAGENYLCQANALTVDATRGTNVVQLTSSVAYTVGELVTINQLYDPDVWWYDEFKFGPNHPPPGSASASNPFSETFRNFFSEWDRPSGQVLEVASVSGTTVTFSTPLHDTYTVANQAHVVRHSAAAAPTCTPVTAPISGIGVENIYFYGVPTDAGTSTQQNGAIQFLGMKNSWVKNVEVFNWTGSAVQFQRCFRCEVRDSYIHQTYQPNPGGGGYSIAFDWQTSDSLAENNVVWAVNKVDVMRSSGGGNVFGYNYFEDGFGAGYQTIQEVGANASHYIGSHFELFEGNQSWNLGGEAVWGNIRNIVFFRNHATGLRRQVPGVTSCGAAGTPMNFQDDVGSRQMATIGPQHDNYSFVGNVFGYQGQADAAAAWSYDISNCNPVTPTILNLGADFNGGADAAQCAEARATALQHGNWNWGFSDTVIWEGGVANQVVPNSLYLSGPPPFFGSNVWPWVNPYTGLFATCAGDYCLPARQRFDTMLAAGTSPCPACLWRN